MKFHCDSKIVLGYINNRKRRFFVYVGNRVDRILRSTSPEQWSYISSELNPADSATRPSNERCALDKWLEGPTHLLEENDVPQQNNFPLVDPDDDGEIRPAIQALLTKVSPPSVIESHRFERFSLGTV